VSDVEDGEEEERKWEMELGIGRVIEEGSRRRRKWLRGDDDVRFGGWAWGW